MLELVPGKLMHMYITEQAKLCLSRLVVCTLGGIIPCASGTVIKNARFVILHWCYGVLFPISVTPRQPGRLQGGLWGEQ